MKVDVKATLALLLDAIYPVGCYLETSKSTTEFNPNNDIGGTWELEAEGKVHISAGSTYTIASTGGAASHQHTVGSSITNSNQIAGAAVVSLTNYTGVASSYPPYVAINRWHRTA